MLSRRGGPLKIEIDLDNVAYGYDSRKALGDVLRSLANDLETGANYGSIYDSNGEITGVFSLGGDLPKKSTKAKTARTL